MNLLVTILSLTPAVGAVFRLLEELPKTGAQPQIRRYRSAKRRARQLAPRRGNHARHAAWRYTKARKPLHALRAP
jgi:hypothetical protein